MRMFGLVFVGVLGCTATEPVAPVAPVAPVVVQPVAPVKVETPVAAPVVVADVGDPGAAVDPGPFVGAAAEFTWGPAVDGLALGLAVGGPDFAEQARVYPRLALKNVSRRPIAVVSHVATFETHLDPFTLTLDNPVPAVPGGNCTLVWSQQGVFSRTVRLTGDRDKSAQVVKTLAPGEVLVHVVDLRAWMLRTLNGVQQLTPNFYRLGAAYTVEPQATRSGDVKLWSGTLTAEPRVFMVGGTRAPEACGSFRTP